jgi:hypothetical protein
MPIVGGFMNDYLDLPKREATIEEMDKMNTNSLFLYKHGVELYIYEKGIISLDRKFLPSGIKAILQKED